MEEMPKTTRVTNTPATDAPDINSRDFYELKGKLDQIVEDTARIRKSESRFNWAFATFVGLLVTAVGTINFLSFRLSSKQAEEAISSAEKRVGELVEKSEKYIDEITGRTKPRFAALKSGDAARPSVVQMGLSVDVDINGGFYLYNLTARTRVEVETSGAPGQFIGSQSYVNGEIVDNFSKKPNSKDTERFIRNFETATYSIEPNGGFQVIEDVPFFANYTMRTNFLNCADAELVLKSILNIRGSVGTLYMRPVFESIENPGTFEKFEIEVYDGRLMDCIGIDQNQKNKVIK